MNQAQRHKRLMINYYMAKLEGKRTNEFDIAQIYPDNFEEYYILLKPPTGLFRKQYQILHMKTSYGSNVKYTYPTSAPSIKFVTKVFHTNVSTDGSICLDILKDVSKWAPTYDFIQIIMNIVLLYQEPYTMSPFNGDASALYAKCHTKFNKLRESAKTTNELNKLEEECFAPYMNKANEVASVNDLSKFEQYFVQLKGEAVDESVYDEARAMLEQLLPKKKTTEDVKKPNKKRWSKYQKNTTHTT